MSIFIKGMDMPENCGKCRFAGVCGVHSVEEWPDIESIMFNEVIGVEGKRDPDCPLVEVPAHGRLVDADKLEETMDDRYSLGEIGRREHDDVVNALRYNAPTVIPKEEA